MMMGNLKQQLKKHQPTNTYISKYIVYTLHLLISF
jgi:hypothetical protein